VASGGGERGVGGKLHALPFKGNMRTVGMFYNRTLFEEAGLRVPDADTTITELSEMATKPTKPDGARAEGADRTARRLLGAGRHSAVRHERGAARGLAAAEFALPSRHGVGAAEVVGCFQHAGREASYVC
jgi:hypothetical protein